MGKNKGNRFNQPNQKWPMQTKRDEEMDEFQQFSTPPALSFVANSVANVKRDEVMVEPSAGTGDLAVWPEIAGAVVILNELAPRRQALLSALFPKAQALQRECRTVRTGAPAFFAKAEMGYRPISAAEKFAGGYCLRAARVRPASAAAHNSPSVRCTPPTSLRKWLDAVSDGLAF